MHGRRARRMGPQAALVLVGLMLSGSHATAPAPPVATATPMTIAELQAEGDAHFARGDYESALAAYDRALELAPGDPKLYYRVAAAGSHLGRREEAIAALLWVVRYGPPDNAEARLAREWLEQQDLLPGQYLDPPASP